MKFLAGRINKQIVLESSHRQTRPQRSVASVSTASSPPKLFVAADRSRTAKCFCRLRQHIFLRNRGKNWISTTAPPVPSARRSDPFDWRLFSVLSSRLTDWTAATFSRSVIKTKSQSSEKFKNFNSCAVSEKNAKRFHALLPPDCSNL